MRYIKLFEIPIYATKEEVFNKRYEDFFKKSTNKKVGTEKKEYYDFLRNFYFPQRIWEYNQIIGYLVISYKDRSIWFDYYMTMDKRIRSISRTKHFIQYMGLSGYHFYISKMDNVYIKENIRDWLISFEKDILSKRNFLDKKLFLENLDYIDIVKKITDIIK